MPDNPGKGDDGDEQRDKVAPDKSIDGNTLARLQDRERVVLPESRAMHRLTKRDPGKDESAQHQSADREIATAFARAEARCRRRKADARNHGPQNNERATEG